MSAYISRFLVSFWNERGTYYFLPSFQTIEHFSFNRKERGMRAYLTEIPKEVASTARPVNLSLDVPTELLPLTLSSLAFRVSTYFAASLLTTVPAT